MESVQPVKVKKGVHMQKFQDSVLIRFDNPQEVNEFVKVANYFNEDIDVYCGRYVVNGKSIMSVLGLDLHNELLAKIHSFNAERCFTFTYLMGKYIKED